MANLKVAYSSLGAVHLTRLRRELVGIGAITQWTDLFRYGFGDNLAAILVGFSPREVADLRKVLGELL